MCWSWWNTPTSANTETTWTRGTEVMATVLTMPGVATGDDGALIVAWSKQEGEAVAVGDVLLEIETEKAIVEMNAESAGVLARILVPAGRTAEVGAPIGVL